MGKRSIIFATVATVATVAVLSLAWLMLRSPEPVYQGKTVSYWLEQWPSDRTGFGYGSGSGIRFGGGSAGSR